MFYVAFGPNKQDFHSLRETFILNLTRFSETGFQCFSLISSWGSSLLEALAGTTCSTTKLSSAQSAQSVATKMTTWRQGNDKGKPHNCALMIFSNYMIWVKILKFDRLPFHQEYLPSLGSKQSQRAITLLLTRRGPSYCFPLPIPTVDTQTFWICGKGSCEKCTPSHQLTCGGRKNLQNWNFSAPRNAFICDWSLIFILFSRDQYHTWKHRRISIALILYDKFLRVN